MKTIRCFIAIEISAEVRQSLTRLQDKLARAEQGRAVRWVEPANIHLTLKFLGDTEVADLDRIGACLDVAASHIAPFTLRLGNLGCFPNPRKPRVVWVGVDGDLDQVIRLQQDIENRLATLGWPAESRRFHPHLTLGRVNDSRQVVEARYPWGQAGGLGEQEVREVCLVESDLQPTGAVYTVRRRASLGTGPAGSG